MITVLFPYLSNIALDCPAQLRCISGYIVNTFTISWKLIFARIPLGPKPTNAKSSGRKGHLNTAFGLTGAQRVCNTGEPQIRAKQLSMAVTARVIWLCASVRYWPRRKLESGCVICFYFALGKLWKDSQ